MPRKTFSAIFFLMILLFGPGTISAQSSIRVEVDRTTLSTDEQLLLSVIVTSESATLPDPDVSNLQDFVIISRSSSTQISIINGQMTAQGVYNYILQPLKSGTLFIPPIPVTVSGQIYQSDPLQIEVTVGSTAPPTPDENLSTSPAPDELIGQNLFVEAEVDNLNPYLGQQILYTFRFYQAIDYPVSFQGRLDYQAPAFTDFWSQTLSQPQYTTQVGGRSYTVTEIRTALFPSGLNEITIKPAKLVVPGGLFSPDVVLETDPLNINVRSLPEGAPLDFNGAVGQFELQTSVDATQGRVNEPITLAIEIEGRGNIETLTEPQLPKLSLWRFFDSQSSTTLDPRDDGLYGIRRFERLMVPGQAGGYTIPAINFSYYDPAAEQYRTRTTEPILLTIEPGVDEFGAIVEPGGLAEGDIHALKPVPASLTRSRFFSLLNPLYWLCWIIPLFIIGTIWVFQNQRRRLSTDAGYARRLRAKRIAQQILKEASQAGVDQYAAAQRALLGYLSDKLNRPTTGLTTTNLVKLLAEYKLAPTLIERIRGILAHIETSRFAPVEEASVQSLLSDTWQLINDLEKSLTGRRL